MSFSCLCWKCKKSTNQNLCIWVKTLKTYPKGVEFGKGRDVAKCPLFEHDNLVYSKHNNLNDVDKAKILGISYLNYAQIKKWLKDNNLKHITIEDYLKFKKYKLIRENGSNKLSYEEIAKKYNISLKILNNHIQYIKRKGLNITIEEYLQQLFDKENRIKEEKKLAKKYGITYSRYCYVKHYIKKLNLNMSVYEYLTRDKKSNNIKQYRHDYYMKKKALKNS